MKGGFGEVAIAGECGLPVVEDEGKVLVFKGAKFDEEMVVFYEAKLFPLIRIYTVQKGPAWLVGNFFK